MAIAYLENHRSEERHITRDNKITLCGEFVGMVETLTPAPAQPNCVECEAELSRLTRGANVATNETWTNK